MNNKENEFIIPDGSAEFEIPDTTLFDEYSKADTNNEEPKSAKTRKKRTVKKPAEDSAQLSFEIDGIFDTATKKPDEDVPKTAKTGKKRGKASDKSVGDIRYESSSSPDAGTSVIATDVNEVEITAVKLDESADKVVVELADTVANAAITDVSLDEDVEDAEAGAFALDETVADAEAPDVVLADTVEDATAIAEVQVGEDSALDGDEQPVIHNADDSTTEAIPKPADFSDDNVPPEAKEDDISTAAITAEDIESASNAVFETDNEGRRIIPEDYFPDDALSVSEPAPEPVAEITDLLGDPITETTVVDTVSVDEAPIEPTETVEQEYEHPDPTIEPEAAYDPEHPRRIDAIFDFIELLIFTLVSVLVITSFFVKHAVVDGGSMLNTLEHGDVLIISDLFYEPTPGDIIVFEDYTLEKEAYRKPLVKRVIAVEGQRVLIKRDGIYVDYNDPTKPLDEPYVYTGDPDYEYRIEHVCDELRALDTFGFNSEGYWFVVPEGEVFALGDHRDDSTDSRTLGTIRVDAILGRVLFRVFPFDKIGNITDTVD